MTGPSRFFFLSVDRTLGAPADWNRPEWPKLWLYNLHYFDDLNADGAEDRVDWHRELIRIWIRDNPPGQGNGWEPYPISLRIVNWIKWAHAGNRLDSAVVQSLAVQARWLMARFEWDLLGNHLLANAKALIFAGAFFEGEEAHSWMAQGLRVMRQQLREQILADGGHFERSPMYHSIVLEDLLDLIQFLRRDDFLAAHELDEWREIAGRMLAWQFTMTHPDGEIAFFNDAAIGIAPNAAAISRYAVALGVAGAKPEGKPFALLSDSGYIRMEKGGAVLFIDVARVGPDYLPGHAHADTLSFELSLFGQRALVNTGTSEYGVGTERLRQRGTGAHNTVQIDGQDSSEVWSGFRVARRARPFDLRTIEHGELLEVSCAHDGYRRLPGAPVHRRRWRLAADGLEIDDDIEGGFREALALFHIHPRVQVEGARQDGRLRLPSGREIRWVASGGQCRVEPSTWHPEFGAVLASKRLALEFEGTSAALKLSWA